jgi:hypothetical protein
MTLKQFEDTLKKLLTIKVAIDNINKELKVISKDFNYFSLGYVEDLLVNTIKIAMGGDDNDWMGYWLYERNAEFSKEKIITLPDGEKIGIDSYKTLYKLITEL